MNGEKSHAWEAIIIGILVIVIIGAAFAFYQYLGTPPLPPGQSANELAEPERTAGTRNGSDLGQELYVKSVNPIEGTIPETFAPVPNPIESVYKNPFQ